jgi:hypothetical protein
MKPEDPIRSICVVRSTQGEVESAKRKAPPIAGLIPVSGKSAASLPSQGRRRQGWIDRAIEAQVPAKKIVHVILDNYAAHKIRGTLGGKSTLPLPTS